MTDRDRRVEKHVRAHIHFLAEQDGPPEHTLKAAFVNILGSAPHVKSAYLAVVQYGEANAPAVALCVRSATGPDERLGQSLGSAFAAQFGASQYLDILFLEGTQEVDLRKVCRPFYVSARQ